MQTLRLTIRYLSFSSTSWTDAIYLQFGSTTPTANMPLYELLVRKMAESTAEWMKRSKNVCNSGMIINTCGYITGDGYKTLLTIAESFEADLVICLEHERLYMDLNRDLPNFVKVFQYIYIYIFFFKSFFVHVLFFRHCDFPNRRVSRIALRTWGAMAERRWCRGTSTARGRCLWSRTELKCPSRVWRSAS